jgi:XapX domain-containing protein
MTLVMETGFRYLPPHESYPLPPRRVTENVTAAAGVHHELSEEHHAKLTWINHFGYGAAAGIVYELVKERLPGPPVVAGALFGLGVWAGSYLGWLPAADLHPPATEEGPNRNALMIAAHLVWGAALGKMAGK